MDINIHGVTGVKLYRKYDSNSGCRIIIIESSKGEVELTLYGDTSDLDNLPIHEEYKDYD